MELEARVEQVEKENLRLRCENDELHAKCRNLEDQLRHIGDYKTAFKLLVAEIKEAGR